MLAALDVYYDESAHTGTAAAVVFDSWDANVAVALYTVRCAVLESYVAGEFFRRELPCLLTLLSTIPEPLEIIVIDGYVILGKKPGLGMRLWESLDRKVAVIGVAKTRYRQAGGLEIFRGESRTPLFLSAIGIDENIAKQCIEKMAGPYRIPTLLRKVDQLSRCPHCGGEVPKAS